MGEIILFTGGAKSGKSTEAERQVREASYNSVAYVATQANVVMDEETKHNIKKHQEHRPSSWDTIEAFRDLHQVIKKAQQLHHHEAYLIDCLTLWTTNLFFDELPQYLMKKLQLNDLPSYSFCDASIAEFKADDIAYFDNFFETQVEKLLTQMTETDADFYIVTNEIGLGVVPETALGRLYREWLGKINQRIAAKADKVYLNISGITLPIKGV